VAVKPIATVLRDYQLHGATHPPLYAFALAAGLAGALSAWCAAGDKELAGACLLVTSPPSSCWSASDAFEFSWR